MFGFCKTRHILLSDSANCTVLRAVVLTQYQRVADGRTDGQTDGIAVASTALAMWRDVKYYRNWHALDRMALLFDHLERPIITPNHTIFRERELMFTFAMLSPIRLPVVCLSVTLVHNCTLQRRFKFSAIFL